MLTRVLVGLTLLLGVSYASEYQKAKVLEKVNALGVRADQVTLLHEAAKTVAAARALHKQEMDAQIASEAWLKDVVAALASGATLSEDQRLAFRAAEGKRREIDGRLNNSIDGAIDSVANRLSAEQRMKIGVPNNVREQASQQLQAIRGAQGRDWERLRGNLAEMLTRREMEKLRGQYRNRESGNTRNDNRQELRQQERQIEQQAISYLNLVKQGNSQAVKNFESTFAVSAMRDGEADRMISNVIREIITNDWAVSALEERLKTGR